MTRLMPLPTVPHVTSAQVQGIDGQIILCLNDGAPSASLYSYARGVPAAIQLGPQAMLDLAEALVDAAGRCGNGLDPSQVEIDPILP